MSAYNFEEEELCPKKVNMIEAVINSTIEKLTRHDDE